MEAEEIYREKMVLLAKATKDMIRYWSVPTPRQTALKNKVAHAEFQVRDAGKKIDLPTRNRIAAEVEEQEKIMLGVR